MRWRRQQKRLHQGSSGGARDGAWGPSDKEGTSCLRTEDGELIFYSCDGCSLYPSDADRDFITLTDPSAVLELTGMVRAAQSALQRLRANTERIFDDKPVRDWDEVLAEADAVLNSLKTASLPSPVEPSEAYKEQSSAIE